MPAYEICYLDTQGALTYKFAADCDDDNRAKTPKPGHLNVTLF